MKKKRWDLSRRSFMKASGLACGYALFGFRMAKEGVAKVLDMVGIRQNSVYNADANSAIYWYRKSQNNPMVKALYANDGFLWEGPGGHHSHELLHTHYRDRSTTIEGIDGLRR
ncbi:periplasmic [Fe] hydrogenase small subunit [Desulfoluna limicola]|uniref:Periplasmic [Fe] hydrogenase small subunit n=1 Tax=Desulfoluna limicola TaxID=2810562 RepID=A0ABM7PMS7_9BACT|nr:iron hydrogenase small subunit [Desulfoluna limicola]BCS98841.1 periplasmic [Fe] hydrogenase small subunit [Desulfoluna limicola]